MNYCVKCGSELIRDDKCFVCGSTQPDNNVETNVDNVQDTFNVVAYLQNEKQLQHKQRKHGAHQK